MPLTIAFVVLAAAVTTAVLCGRKADADDSPLHRRIGATALLVAAIDLGWLVALMNGL